MNNPTPPTTTSTTFDITSPAATGLDFRPISGQIQIVLVDWLLLALAYLWAVFLISLGVYALAMRGHSSRLVSSSARASAQTGCRKPLSRRLDSALVSGYNSDVVFRVGPLELDIGRIWGILVSVPGGYLWQ